MLGINFYPDLWVYTFLSATKLHAYNDNLGSYIKSQEIYWYIFVAESSAF